MAVAGISLFKPEAFAADPPSATAQLSPFERAQIEDGRLTHGRDAGLKAAAGLAAVAAGLLGLARFQQGRDDARRADKAQFNQRFIDAVGMLGNPSDDIKLGGLYALEQLAVDSSDHRPPTIEVLCAYVRHHSRSFEVVESISDAMAFEMDSVSRAVTKVLITQMLFYDSGQSFNLVGARFAGSWSKADDEGLRFSGANLRSADFSGVRSGGADLRGAQLANANLRCAFLGAADLRKASSPRANYEGAFLASADLTDADLADAHLSGAHLNEARMVRANLQRADLTIADLGGADLTGADLRQANFTGAVVNSTTKMPDGWEKVVKLLPDGKPPTT